MIKLSGVYTKYSFSIAEKAGALIDININHIEDSKAKDIVGQIGNSNFNRQTTGMKLPPVDVGVDL